MNRNRCRAALGAAAVTATLLASGAGVSPASAATTTGDRAVHAGQHGSKDKGDKEDKGDKGDKGGKDKGSKGGKSDAEKLAKAVAKADDAFERLLSRAEKKLGDEDHASVAANIAADRALLAQLTTVADVRALQPENYDQVIAWLRKAERLEAKVASPDEALTEAAAAAVAELLTITASSDKADLRAAKQLLRELKDLVEVAETETETETETEDETETETETEDESETESESESESEVETESESEVESEVEDETETESGGHGRHGGHDG